MAARHTARAAASTVAGLFTHDRTGHANRCLRAVRSSDIFDITTCLPELLATLGPVCQLGLRLVPERGCRGERHYTFRPRHRRRGGKASRGDIR